MSFNKISLNSVSDYSDISTNTEDEDEDDSNIDWSLKIFNDRYIIIKKLGRGSYCSVWLTYDHKLNKMIALKIYNRDDYKRAKREIKIFDEIKSKSIINVITYIDKFVHHTEEYDSNEDDSNSEASSYTTNKFLCVTMELCGYSLNDIITIFKKNKIYIPANIILDWHDKILNILNLMHKNVLVHTDIKPENILTDIPRYDILNFINLEKELKNKKRKDIINIINKNENENKNKNENKNENIFNYIYDYIIFKQCNIYLCDMGTTMKPGDHALYKNHTLYYRSPESILEIGWDETYDLWSLGCTLYELTENKILFNINNNLELLYDIQKKFGIYPEFLLKQSPIKYKYYNKKLTRLRGYKEIKFVNIYDSISSSESNQQIWNLITKYLNYEIKKRI
jgi:serine/threonine protein kinase